MTLGDNIHEAFGKSPELEDGILTAIRKLI